MQTDEQYATELFALYANHKYSLDFILESAWFDLKSENVANLILVKVNESH